VHPSDDSDMIAQYGVCGECGAARMPVESDGLTHLFCSRIPSHTGSPDPS
jgi:hypothetical protein